MLLFWLFRRFDDERRKDKSLVILAAQGGHDEVLWLLLQSGAGIFPIQRAPLVATGSSAFVSGVTLRLMPEPTPEPTHALA